MLKIANAFLLVCGLAAAPFAMAADRAEAAASSASIDRMTDAMVEFMPMGRIFDLALADNPDWPLGEKKGEASAEQLACIRGELSSAGYRRAKREEVAQYIHANPSRIDEELRLLESGAATLMGKLVMGGAEAARTGVKFDENDVLRSATNEQALSLITAISDPRFAQLRKLSGVGDILDPQKSKEEMEKAGQQLGYSMGAQQIIKAMGTCKVPPAAYL